jgi:hypothetical protein
MATKVFQRYGGDRVFAVVTALLLAGSLAACEGMTSGQKGGLTGAALGTGISMVAGGGVATTVGAGLIGGAAGYLGGSAIGR